MNQMSVFFFVCKVKYMVFQRAGGKKGYIVNERDLVGEKKCCILYGENLEETIEPLKVHHHHGIKIQIIFRNGNGCAFVGRGSI